MAENRTSMKILLVSNESERSQRLCECLARHRFGDEVSELRPGRRAAAIARGSRHVRSAGQFDLVMVDFSASDAPTTSMLTQLSVALADLPVPLIVLTSPETEAQLDTVFDAGVMERSFAPTALHSFIARLRRHSPQRFLRALGVVSRIGPVVVSLPGYLLRPAEDVPVFTDSQSKRQVA